MSSPPDPLPFFHPFTLVALGFAGLIIVLLAFLRPPSPPSVDKKQHAVITGGSSGIGTSLAEQCAKSGVKNVTILARNKSRLEKVKKELSEKYPSTKFCVYSVDISDNKAVEKTSTALVKESGGPTLLFNNAGVTSVLSFKDTPASEFEHLMNCNYLGTVYVTKSLLKDMPAGSCIMITSSAAGSVGVYGYTCYSPTKFALRGFAECLQSEVRRDGISVSLSFPPDTNTPMLENENKTKPLETKLISDATGTIQPQLVAKSMVEAALSSNPPFMVYFGLEGWMLSTLTAGMSPVHGIVDSLCQVALMGILRLVSLCYLWDFTRIISKCGKEKED